MRVLSLFDGISCGQLALHRAGFTPSVYFASEIDQSAIAITQRNFPHTIQLGNVQKLEPALFGNIDLLMGGSPCQGFSKLGKGSGFIDERSKLVFYFIKFKAIMRPRYWLLENVKMSQKNCDILSILLGCKPVEINSALLSAQSRKRLYWTNIPIAPIIDRKISFQSIREMDGPHLDKYATNKTKSRFAMWANGVGRTNGGQCPNITVADKSYCLTIKQDRSPNAGLIAYKDFCRYLTHKECERLQTLPDDYTLGAGWNARYRHLGNGWTVDVIAHILRGMHT